MEMITNHDLIDIWHLAQQGDYTTAKHKIIHLLRDQPECVPAWLLLAELVSNYAEKEKCYRQVLEIDANNETAVQFFRVSQIEMVDDVDKNPRIPDLFDEKEFSDQEIDFDDEFDEDENQEDLSSSDLSEDDSLTAYVVKELGGHVDEDDIIREVSLRGQMDWYKAEKYVGEIKDKHALTIAKRRTPLQLIIAIPTLTAGIVWFVITGVTVLSNGYNSLNLIAILLQSIRDFIGSIAMVLGGSLGIYRVLKSLGKIN